MEWLDNNRIKVDIPKKPKKITGTRFATILGLNPWSTPFEMFCAITRAYEQPFEDNQYTVAGKTIEPKQALYMENAYGMDLIRPADLWGEDYFNQTYGDFFVESAHLGGMWDFLLKGDDDKPTAVLEMKTTKRIEDWQDGPPEYYALQASLYAYLLGLDDVIMVASFLDETDYKDPSKYKPSVKNTAVIEFKVSERYPDFADKVAQVEKWWDEHIETGISPAYDEKKDSAILTELRKHSLSPTTDISDFIIEAEKLMKELAYLNETYSIPDKEKRLSELNGFIKEHAITQFREGDTKVELKGFTYTWNIRKSATTTINKAKLEADGLLDKYSTTTDRYVITSKGA